MSSLYIFEPAAGQYLVWAGGHARRRKDGLELICRLRRKRFRRQLMVPGTFSFSNRINLKVTFDLPRFIDCPERVFALCDSQFTDFGRAYKYALFYYPVTFW